MVTPRGCEEVEVLLRPCANRCSESVLCGAGWCTRVIAVKHEAQEK